VGGLPVENGFTRGADQGDFKVGEESALSPDRARAETLTIRAELGNEGVLHAQRRREMTDKRGKELRPRLGFDAFHYSAQGRILCKRKVFTDWALQSRVVLPVSHGGLGITFMWNATKAGNNALLTVPKR
jgi:hypothetical protein